MSMAKRNTGKATYICALYLTPASQTGMRVSAWNWFVAQVETSPSRRIGGALLRTCKAVLSGCVSLPPAQQNRTRHACHKQGKRERLGNLLRLIGPAIGRSIGSMGSRSIRSRSVRSRFVRSRAVRSGNIRKRRRLGEIRWRCVVRISRRIGIIGRIFPVWIFRSSGVWISVRQATWNEKSVWKRIGWAALRDIQGRRVGRTLGTARPANGRGGIVRAIVDRPLEISGIDRFFRAKAILAQTQRRQVFIDAPFGRLVQKMRTRGVRLPKTRLQTGLQIRAIARLLADRSAQQQGQHPPKAKQDQAQGCQPEPSFLSLRHGRVVRHCQHECKQALKVAL
jgi:hypothetical protein